MKQKAFRQRPLKNDEISARIEALEFQARKTALELISVERAIGDLLQGCDCPSCRRRRSDIDKILKGPELH